MPSQQNTLSSKQMWEKLPHLARYYNLCQIKAAIKLEMVGLTHSSGRSVRRHACLILGLATTTKAPQVIEAIEKKQAQMIAEKQAIQTQSTN